MSTWIIVIPSAIGEYTVFAQLSHGAQESIEQGTIGAHHAYNYEQELQRRLSIPSETVLSSGCPSQRRDKEQHQAHEFR